MSWHSLTRETSIATQEVLQEILGLSRATFRASSFLAQGDGAAFTEAQPRDRKAILGEILGLDVYDKLLDRARGELRAVEDELLRSTARLTALEQELAAAADVPNDLAAARRDLAEARERQVFAEGILDRAQQAVADNAAAAERLRTREVEARAAGETLEQARQAYAAAVNAGEERARRQADLEQAAQIADTVPALEAELSKAHDAMALAVTRRDLRERARQHYESNTRRARENDELREHAAELAGKAEHLEQHIGEAAECDRCGQTLGAEAAARAIASFRAEAVEAETRAAAAAKEIEQESAAIAALVQQADAIVYDESLRAPELIEMDLGRGRAAAERRAGLAEQVRTLTEGAARQDELAIALADAAETLTAAQSALTVAAEGVADQAQLQQSVVDARAAVQSAAATVETRRAVVTRLEVAEQRAQTVAVELAEGAAASGGLQRQIDLLKLAEKAFGRDGIPALILESSAIPSIEVEANRILAELGTTYRVELRTQRALKTSESLRETLDVLVFDGVDLRAYETFSGGERTRVNLALRLALAGLLAHRRGAESRLLAIDELDGLDAAGMDALVAVLQGLSSTFDRVLIVSHQPQLASSFDQAIIVVKEGDRSRVVDGGGEAGVPVAA